MKKPRSRPDAWNLLVCKFGPLPTSKAPVGIADPPAVSSAEAGSADRIHDGTVNEPAPALSIQTNSAEAAGSLGADEDGVDVGIGPGRGADDLDKSVAIPPVQRMGRSVEREMQQLVVADC